jgi:hypothetical protein
MVSRVIAAPVSAVWQFFVDPLRRVDWLAEVASVTVLDESDPALRWRESYGADRTAACRAAELSLTVLEAGRRCRVGLVGRGSAPQRIYAFTPVEVGQHRGGTVVTVVDDRPAQLADRLFDLLAGGFVARTVEGAVRKELDALAAACTQVIARTAA